MVEGWYATETFILATTVCSHSVTQLSNLTMLLGSFHANLVT